ncbi:trypsin-2-like [Lytechinus variegatus]|uniref:trypsin-2-like n=1 Tax=Lytechinus variegatus TaxID=7654 RepID=UPI001BB14400|nr:trypsin-2-like [Lytechinus variegatus]
MTWLFSLLAVSVLLATSMAADWQANPTECGKTYGGMNTMIIGGEPAEEYAWPWQLALFKNGNFVYCGASLIDPWWVMTAAHCVDRCYLCNPSEAYEFRAGSTSITQDTDFTQQLPVSKIIVHPEFDFEAYWNEYYCDNDIALFKMKEPFTLNEDYQVNTVCLPTSDMDDQFVVGQDAFVTGWGTMKRNEGLYPDELQEMTVPIFNQSECEVLLDARGGIVTDNMICAGLKEGGVDASNGDSGGPMVSYPLNNTEQYYQIGVVSWGIGGGTPSPPGVYTRVTRYADWIQSFLNATTQESYIPCICYEEDEGDGEELSSSITAVISVLSILLAIFVGTSVGLGLCLWRQGKKA